MAAINDTWNIYEQYDPFTNLLGSFDVEMGEESTLSTKLSEAGIAIPQGAIGVYYHGGSLLLDDIVPSASGGGTEVNTVFVYGEQPETITGFYLDGTEYKFEGGGTVVSGDSGTTYIIKVSSSAPASGTASNIITIVTD